MGQNWCVILKVVCIISYWLVFNLFCTWCLHSILVLCLFIIALLLQRNRVHCICHSCSSCCPCRFGCGRSSSRGRFRLETSHHIFLPLSILFFSHVLLVTLTLVPPLPFSRQ